MTLMDENEQLTKLLKPVVAMREELFERIEYAIHVQGVQDSAQRIDYLLGATVGAYQFVIQKSEAQLETGWREWHRRYKRADSELVSFYGPGMHCWKMNELIEKLCFECKRTGQKIRTSLHRELILKQLEMCRMMVNYSIEGDIWNRAFGTVLGLIDLLDPEEDPSIMLTQLAQWECVPLVEDSDDSFVDDDFRYPRFDRLKNGHEFLLTLFGVGVDATLYAEGDMPRGLNVSGSLVAIYDEDLEEIITIRYMTSSGIFYREKSFWWNFGHDVGDFFNDLEFLYVRPEFVELFDLEEEHGRRVKLDELTPYALSYEEIFPND